MDKIDYIVRPDLEPFVNCIIVKQERDPGAETDMPLHADGYPGIMFQRSENGFYLLPRRKKLSGLFLYGQTLKPTSLRAEGRYDFVIVQLYPFASKYLLGVNPRELNDDCFDLLQLRHIDAAAFHYQLLQAESVDQQIEIISDLMLELIAFNKVSPDDRIQNAVHYILDKKGVVVISELIEKLHLTERTFERAFLSEIGLTPKQFAKIVQFQYSLRKLTHDSFEKLTEVSADCGFTDQSHFIREFKRYTGQTPSYFLQHVSNA